MQGTTRVCAWPLAALRASVVLLAAALWLLAASPAPAADAPARTGSDTTIKITPFPPSVQVDANASEKDEATSTDGKRGKRHRAHVQIDADPDFESFANVMETAPWIVGLVFLVVGSIFLTPVILLVGIIWYKLRKTRLQNEAWLKLAEKGMAPPAQAVDAMASGTSPIPDSIPAAAGSAPPGQVYQQAKATVRRVVWSDLRKGVLLFAFGVALVLYSITESGTPNWLGLVLLFVGIGYVALWWLEDRRLERRDAGGSTGSGG
jgi:hypothetical protein